MPELPDANPEAPHRERSLLWFYVLLGATAALFACGAVAWKPFRASQWERQVRAAYERGDSKAAGDALDKLDALGPAARTAVGRLLAPNGAWYRGQVVQQLGRKENRWMLPALVRLARYDDDPAVVYLAVAAAESMTGKAFFPLGLAPGATGRPDAGEAGRRFIEWWEREGALKYGG